MKQSPFIWPISFAFAVLLLLIPKGALAQVPFGTTEPVGITTASALADTDTHLSIPFTRPVVFVGTVGSISSNTITVASSPGWTANQFQYVAGTQSNTYYAIIGPNIATVSGTVTLTNGSTAVTATAGLSSLVAGDELIVNGLAYNVAAVTSDTAAVLFQAHTGTTGSGLSATFDHSPKEGSYYTVTANGTNTLTVSLNGDSLGTVASGTSLSLVPYWTLGTAFPASGAGTLFAVSTGSAPRFFGTQILMPDLVDAGYSLAPGVSYFNYKGAWRLAGNDPSISYDDVLLLPSTYFIIRNNATATTFTATGSVYMNRIGIALDTQTNTMQDNAVAFIRPLNVALNDLGLISSGAFSASASSSQLADTLMVYDNTVAGVNKSASAIYFYSGGAWRLEGASDPTVDYGTVTIPCGTGFTIRKAATNTGATSFWQSDPSY